MANSEQIKATVDDTALILTGDVTVENDALVLGDSVTVEGDSLIMTTGVLNKLFVRYIGTKVLWEQDTASQAAYANQVVFIGAETDDAPTVIWAKGQYFGNVSDALANLNYIESVSDSTGTKYTGKAATVKFLSGNYTYVNVVAGTEGITISLTQTTIDALNTANNTAALLQVVSGKVESLITADAAQDEKIAALEKAVGDLTESDITTLQTKVATLETNMGNARAGIVENADNIADLQTDVESLETDRDYLMGSVKTKTVLYSGLTAGGYYNETAEVITDSNYKNIELAVTKGQHWVLTTLTKNAINGYLTRPTGGSCTQGGASFNNAQYIDITDDGYLYVNCHVDGSTSFSLVCYDVAGTIGEIADEKAKAAVAEVVGAAPESLDTLQEVAEWIENDESGAAAMANDIAALKASDIAQEAALETLETNIYSNSQQINTMQDDISGLYDETTQNANDISGLKTTTADNTAKLSVHEDDISSLYEQTNNNATKANQNATNISTLETGLQSYDPWVTVNK